MATEMYTFTERVMCDRDGKAVEFGDPRGVRLLGSPGKKITMEQAKRLGLVTEPKTKPKKAPSDKARTKASNKTGATD